MILIDELLKGFTKIKKIFSTNLTTTLSPSDYLLLLTIEEKGTFNKTFNQKAISISELAKNLEMSKPALAKETKRLEKLEYIKKNTLLHNLKNRYIMITKKGAEKLITERDDIYMLPNLVIKELGEEDSKKFITLLNQINDIIIKSNMKGRKI